MVYKMHVNDTKQLSIYWNEKSNLCQPMRDQSCCSHIKRPAKLIDEHETFGVRVCVYIYIICLKSDSPKDLIIITFYLNSYIY